MAASSSNNRPAVKRSYHTWPTTSRPRSHFEDFLHEIGESSEVHHLCCNPRQAHLRRYHTPERPRRGHSTCEALVHHSTLRGRLTTKEANATRSTRVQTLSRESTALSAHTRGSSLFVPALQTPSSLKGNAVLAVDPEVYEGHRPPDLIRTFSQTAEGRLRDLLGNAAATYPQSRSLGLDAEPQISSDTTSMTAEPDRSVIPNRSLRRSPSTDSLSTISSSEAPATPRNHSPLFGHNRPTLIDVENQSRFRLPAVCVTCKRNGANFPSCSRCGETWCSRGCRLKGSNGTRHHCHQRSVDVRPSYPTVVS
ncbi:hypothetical protein DAEQUDRAFT_354352 [Daedalea quercina L-15889]|uniref:HIT-type domain-containing protein n=1 Tax=Daedalea quercina L-15889 TaxID=1314783 RepID=A0A165TQI5_9APHY|nr:hypothetical protein DAEQUDRAFT_354352 [Daedalea quercina L-15889]